MDRGFRLLDSLRDHTLGRRPQLLIVKLDAIGDYVLFRNFLGVLRSEPRYADHQFILLGNVLWRDLAEHFDRDTIDRFVWMDPPRWAHSRAWKRYDQLRLRALRPSVLLHPRCSRSLWMDLVCMQIRADTKVGSQGDMSCVYSDDKALSDRFYDTLIPITNRPAFELDRMREFLEALLGHGIPITKPHMTVDGIRTPRVAGRAYAVMFPGAGKAFRRWPPARFAAVADHLAGRHDLEVVVAGGRQDRELADQVARSTREAHVVNTAGQLTLPQLAKVIAGAEILVANDTAAVHLAASVDTPFVCVSNGNDFGRFNPYPSAVFGRCRYVYPEDMQNHLDDFDYLCSMYGRASQRDISAVSGRRVEDAIDDLLDTDGPEQRYGDKDETPS